MTALEWSDIQPIRDYIQKNHEGFWTDHYAGYVLVANDIEHCRKEEENA